jgi:multiple sugar transport system permease protein
MVSSNLNTRAGFRPGKKWGKRLADLAAYAILTAVGFTMLLPFVWMVGTSLKSYRELFIWPPQFFPAVPQWDNYPKAWNYSEMVPFARFFVNSTLVSVSVTLGQLITCSTAGYAFARLRFPGRDKLFLLYIATLMVPFQVTLVPLYLIMKELHWINDFKSLIIPGLVSAYGTFLMRQFMSTLPAELEDAARIDGASPPIIFASVILPLCTPALTTLTILAFMGSWNAFLWPLIMISDTELRTLPIGLAFFTSVPETVGYPQYQLLMAAATFSMIPTLVVFLIGQRYFIKGIALSGLKG